MKSENLDLDGVVSHGFIDSMFIRGVLAGGKETILTGTKAAARGGLLRFCHAKYHTSAIRLR